MADRAYSALELRFARMQFGKAARIRVYRQLERLVRNGVPLAKALEGIWNRASNDGRKPSNPQAIVIDAWRRLYRDGKPLAVAMQGWIPDAEQMLIEAGELSGDLPKALHDTVELTQNTGAMRGALVGGLTYPAILVMTLIGMMYLFGVQVIPPFAEVLPVDRWEGVAASMATLSALVQTWTVPVVVVMVLATIVCLVSLPRWTGRLRARFDRIPPWSMYRLVVGTSFLLSFAALIKAGVATPKALSRLNRGASPWLKERIDAALMGVNSGLNPGEALFRSRYGFPDPEIVADMRIYANLPGFETAMDRMAKEWIVEGVQRVRQAANLLNGTILVLMTLAILWLGAGLFSLTQQISDMAQKGF